MPSADVQRQIHVRSV